MIEKKDIGIGYKVFNPDWTCRGHKYEVGKTYYYDGEVAICEAGFHFCPTLVDCFNYYGWDPDNHVAIVHYDKTKSITPDESDKWVTAVIHIEKEILWDDVVRMCNQGRFNTGHRNTGHSNTGDSNTGDWNTGHRNTGDRNTGDRNTGDRNAGHRNTGDWNTGHRNTGDRNTGDWNTGHRNTGDSNTGDWNTGHWNTGDSNTGDRNTGDRNAGHRNTGHRNTGDWNTGHRNTGYLCTTTPSAMVFDKPTSVDLHEISWPDFFFFDLYELVLSRDMTDDEKSSHPEHETTGGFLRVLGYHESWRKSWDNANEDDRRKVLKLPNWDNEKFKEISGIDVEAELNL